MAVFGFAVFRALNAGRIRGKSTAASGFYFASSLCK
jgi:hypothetical protein